MSKETGAGYTHLFSRIRVARREEPEKKTRASGRRVGQVPRVGLADVEVDFWDCIPVDDEPCLISHGPVYLSNPHIPFVFSFRYGDWNPSLETFRCRVSRKEEANAVDPNTATILATRILINRRRNTTKCAIAEKPHPATRPAQLFIYYKHQHTRKTRQRLNLAPRVSCNSRSFLQRETTIQG